MSGRLGIDDVSPVISCGRYPSKAVVGEHIPVRATVWREGHDAVAATVVWRGPHDRGERLTRMAVDDPNNDTWVASVCPDATGMWTFRVDAWSDPWATWRHTVEVKVAAGQSSCELSNDLELGARLLERVSRRPDRRWDKVMLARAAAALREEDAPLTERIGRASCRERVSKQV